MATVQSSQQNIAPHKRKLPFKIKGCPKGGVSDCAPCASMPVKGTRSDTPSAARPPLYLRGEFAQCICKTIKDTKALARAFAGGLRKRKAAIVLLCAPMGAGKTTFVREAVARLGARVPATSPTFSIINQYSENVFHIDLYRLTSAAELQNTALYEIIAGNNFVFIEWADKFEINYPAGSIKVKIKVEEDGNRVFDIAY